MKKQKISVKAAYPLIKIYLNWRFTINKSSMLVKEDISIDQKFKDLWHLVGNTPMLKLHYQYNGKNSHIFVKCEHYNLTGSIKDRMALYIMKQAYQKGLLKGHETIVEATSGNTGISFSAIGKALGHQVLIMMPNWLSRERKEIITSFGALVHLVSKEEGGFIGSIKLAEQLQSCSDKYFLPRQFENSYNIEAHELTTGPEIWEQLYLLGMKPDAFVAGVGTGGTVMGVGRYLRSKNPNVKIHPLEPAESPTLTTGFKVGSHRIQGISDEFIPPIVKLEELDEIIQANDGDAIIMAQKLARELGLAVGISSGANIIGAIKIKENLGDQANVVTLLCDSNKKYLSTDLIKTEHPKDNYISGKIQFTSFQPISRLIKPIFQ